MTKLLLVEDNLDNAGLFTRILETAGYEVVHATHGLEGMKLARQGNFHVILLDFDLPDIDGAQICLSLRRFPTTKITPIIALTAHVDKASQRKAKAFGFNAFISKPCTDRDLLNTIQLFTQDTASL